MRPFSVRPRKAQRAVAHVACARLRLVCAAAAGPPAASTESGRPRSVRLHPSSSPVRGGRDAHSDKRLGLTRAHALARAKAKAALKFKPRASTKPFFQTNEKNWPPKFSCGRFSLPPPKLALDYFRPQDELSHSLISVLVVNLVCLLQWQKALAFSRLTLQVAAHLKDFFKQQ